MLQGKQMTVKLVVSDNVGDFSVSLFLPGTVLTFLIKIYVY